jgi:SAM-dependent methyltransferase
VTIPFGCIVCGSARLEEIKEYNALPRVTSDCKPFAAGGRLFACHGCGGIQKLPDGNWLADIERIYGDYEIYQLSDGAEQLIFTEAGAVPRSQRLVEFLKKSATLPDCGRLIDIGCGNGAALAGFSEVLPRWQLYGSELSDRAYPRLRSVPNFMELYTVPIDEIVGRFDLVSMIHSLEHMPSPRSALEHATRLLAENGALFIEVPDVETSPFDLLVADHLAHFSRTTLSYLLGQIGVSTSVISNTVLPKEITVIGQLRSVEVAPPVEPDGVRLAQATVLWLIQVMVLARDLARTQPFGIFGTSISGMWLFGLLRDAVSFFVDEDPSRIGHEYAGKPILSPLEAPGNATVFVPLAPAVAAKVVERYADAPARFVSILSRVDVSVKP